MEYQDGGGHNGQGGFVIFLSDILNETEARDKYSQLTIEDTSNFTRKLEDNFLDLTFEVLLFNENYEWGVVITFEFLQNNAGEIDKSISTIPIYQSKYNPSYHFVSGSTRIFLICVDISYFLWFLFLFWKIGWNLWDKGVNTIRLRINMFETSEILDLIVLLLSISTIILYSISVIAEERVKVPVVTEDKYQHYIDEANFALATMFLSITTIIIMTMRFLWILTTHLPIFGCIFYTITYAFKDLMHICTTIFVIVLGIAFSINLIYGSGDSLFEDLWTVQLQLIYILINPNAFGKYQDGMFGDNYTPLFMGLFLYFFMIVLYFTLILTLTSILIVRYRFLRATIQQRSEAVALIIHKQTKEYISKWVHLMLCRRPRDTQQVNTNDDESGLTLWVKMRINFNDILFGFKLKNKKEKEEEVQDAMKKIKALKVSILFLIFLHCINND